jgi:predicted ATPase
MNEDFPLRSFEVHGYRGIRHLQLPTLERVNLFVGMNNAGKTSLLEALWIHAEPQPVSALWELLRQRNEYNRFRSAILRGRNESISEGELEQATRAVESLYFRDAENRLAAGAEFVSSGRSSGTTRLFLPWLKPLDMANTEPAFFGSEDDALISVERAESVTNLPLKGFFGYIAPGDDEVVFIGPGGFDRRMISAFWSRAAGLGQAPLVEEAFRSFLPEARRIHTLSGAEGLFPVLAIELEGTSRPVPLIEMGDGTRRVLGIILAMVNTTGGVLLIDEVENGLHHSVQDEVWEAIVSLSEQLDVQVFATTHSWDTVVGFQRAANRSPVKGMLYRLEREKDGGVYAERYTGRDVAVAAEQQVEVR